MSIQPTLAKNTLESIVGWQPNPDRRGTLALLTTCIFTIIACTWSILHLNVPAPSDTASRIFRRKFQLAIMTTFLPEIILAHAIMERSAAIESLQELKELNIPDLEVCYDPWSWRRVSVAIRIFLKKALCCYSTVKSKDGEQDILDIGPPRMKWTLKHSYYANMAGLRLGLEDGKPICKFSVGSLTTMSLTTRQFGYLRQKGIISATPNIPIDEIDDKAKTDFFTKGIALLQIFWLIVSMCERAARNLAISQLEILTIAFAACAVITYFFLWDKPQANRTTYVTLGTAGISQRRQFHRIHNNNIKISKGQTQLVSLWLTASIMLFGAIHLGAWNHTFPSSAEKILWRATSIFITSLPLFSVLNIFTSSVLHEREAEIFDYEYSIVTIWNKYIAARRAAGALDSQLLEPKRRLGDGESVDFDQLEMYLPCWKKNKKQMSAIKAFVAQQKASPMGRIRVENFEFFISDRPNIDFYKRKWEVLKWLKQKRHESWSTSERVVMYIDQRSIATVIFILAGFVYVMFRLLIIILSFMSLRAMPESVYQTTWARIIPSVQ